MSRAANRTVILSVAALAWLAVTVIPAPACDTPVYRYALEGWPPDPYVAFIFHKGELTEDQDEIVTVLRKAMESEEAPTNIYVRPVDVSGELGKIDKGIWEAVKTESLPLVAITYPGLPNAEGVVWKSPLDLASAKLVLDSPVRHEAATRLIRGETCVWILIESGKKDLDDAAVKLIETVPKEVPSREAPPDPYAPLPEDDEDAELAARKWEMRSSVLRISRDNAAEAMLLKILLGSEPDLYDKEYEGEPMAFPVFGRGRVLFALVGKGINRDNILMACEFLLGPCACEIKNLNPGTDTLIAANWDLVHSTILEEIDLPSLAHMDPPLPIAAPAATAAPAAALTPGETEFESSPGLGATLTHAIYVLAGVLVLVIVLTVVIRARAGASG